MVSFISRSRYSMLKKLTTYRKNPLEAKEKISCVYHLIFLLQNNSFCRKEKNSCNKRNYSLHLCNMRNRLRVLVNLRQETDFTLQSEQRVKRISSCGKNQFFQFEISIWSDKPESCLLTNSVHVVIIVALWTKQIEQSTLEDDC